MDDMDPTGPGPAAPDLKRLGWRSEEWIEDSFAQVHRELAALQAIKRDKKQPVVFLQMPAEVLKAYELTVITKAEARKLLGIAAGRKRPQPPALARAQAARRKA